MFSPGFTLALYRFQISGRWAFGSHWALIEGKPFPMTLGEQTRDYIYVTDIVEALMRAAWVEPKGSIFNIGSQEPIKVAALAEMISRLLGNRNLIRLGEKAYRPGEVMEYFVDTSKAKQVLGWTPQVGLKEGLERTIEYYKKMALK